MGRKPFLNWRHCVEKVDCIFTPGAYQTGAIVNMIRIALPVGNGKGFHDGHDSTAMNDEGGAVTGSKMPCVMVKGLADTMAEGTHVVSFGNGAAAHGAEPFLIQPGTMRICAELIRRSSFKQAEICFFECAVANQGPAGKQNLRGLQRAFHRADKNLIRV